MTATDLPALAARIRELSETATADHSVPAVHAEMILTKLIVNHATTICDALERCRRAVPTEQTRELRDLADKYEKAGDVPIAVIAMRLAAGTIERMDAEIERLKSIGGEILAAALKDAQP